MNIVGLIVEAVKNIAALCNKLVDAADAKKYAEGVQKLNQSVDETYNKMRELILADDSLTTEEKLEKLEKLAQSQETARQTCEKAIQGNKEHIAKIATEIFAALTTCGISYLPKIVSGIKSSKKQPEVAVNENERPSLVEETSKTND